MLTRKDMNRRYSIPYILSVAVLSLFTVHIGRASAPQKNLLRHKLALQPVATIVQQAVDEGTIPGAVVLIGHNGRVVYRKASAAARLSQPASR